MLQAHLAVAAKIFHKLLSLDEGKVAVDVLLKTIFVADEVQDGEEDDEQFLVEVDLPFLVDRVQIDGSAFLHDGRSRGNGAGPVYFVHSCMEVLQYKEEETLVVLVELNEGQQNIEEGVALSAVAPSCLRYLLLINDIGGVVRVVLEDHDGTVYPHGKLIDEILFGLVVECVVCLEVNDVAWLILSKDKFAAFLVFEHHLRKNKDAVTK